MIKEFNALILYLVLAATCYSQDPFGRREQVVYRDQQIIDLSNDSFRLNPEHLAAYESIYSEFIGRNFIDDEGQFVPGKGTPDSPATRAYFKDYISKNRMQHKRTVPRRCSNCLGNSKKWIKTEPNNPLSLGKVEVDCPDCPSDGRIPTEVTFTLICMTQAVPALPEKPRVIRQRMLVGKADAGDSFSQVEYASQLEAGAKGVDRNLTLALDYYKKAAIQGNGHSLDGILRTLDSSSVKMTKKENFVFMLKLVKAKLTKDASGQGSYYLNVDDLGVSVPPGMTYIEVKTAEIMARTFRSYFLSKDLEPSHFSHEGSLGLLRPMKKQIEKAPLATARAKVEYVLISHALTGSVEGFGSERLTLIKQAAVSLDPAAFGLLGDISASGLNGAKNYQAASIFYKISSGLRKDRLADAGLDSLQYQYDQKITREMVDEFEKTKVAGQANINFIEAMLKINNQKHDTEK